jgi:hypothetical protein
MVLAACGLACLTAATAALAQDEAWDPRFDANGMSGNVRAIAIAPDGDVYAGGFFTVAGGVEAMRVARWDGGSWSALGSGVTGDVFCIAVDSQGMVYVGGSFTVAGGNIAGRVAVWNGSSWSDLDGGMSNEVYALAVDGNDNLYAGGKFTVAGGVTAGRIAMWDGRVWTDLDGGLPDEVYALAVDGDDNLYAGGKFTVAPGASALRVAKWNGTSWSALGSGISHEVRALAVADNGDLYAGGLFTTAGGVLAGRIARWNGSTWSDLDGGMSSDVFAIATSGTDVYAGGVFTVAGGNAAFRVAKWDGASWSGLGSGVGETNVWALAAKGEDLYVGGDFTAAGGKASLRFARYNPAIVPVLVQAFTADARDDGIRLQWRVLADEEVAGYRIYRKPSQRAEFTAINHGRLLPAHTDSYTDGDVRPGTTYLYRLAAVSPDGTETVSRSIEARVPEQGYRLEQNFPNPFNPITTIRFYSPRGDRVRLVVYDVHGKSVATLFDGVSPGGEVELHWNGRSDAGTAAGSGVYFCRLQAAGRSITRKMLLIK